MSSQSEVSEALLAGRRGLDEISGVRLLTGFRRFGSLDLWAMQCAITVASANHVLVPPTTNWWMVVSPDYPLGRIILYPAKEKGLTRTFAHQSLNTGGSKDLPWRDGDICVRTPHSFLQRAEYDVDPVGDAAGRLAWYASRAKKWLEDASYDRLLKNGDPFEVPAFPRTGVADHTVVFSEDSSTFSEWQRAADTCGLTEMVRAGPVDAKTLVIRRFLSFSEIALVEPSWGTVISSAENVLRGIWIRLDAIPCRKPYEVPATWGDLFNVVSGFEAQFQKVVRHIRDGDDRLLVVGFPIPSLVGGANVQHHWQPIWLPGVSWKDKFAKGFRANELGYWRRDRQKLFYNEQTILWEHAENWNSSQANTRGMFDADMNDKRMLMIGCGALGSVVAEILVRGGLKRLVLFDLDAMKQVNLCRHLLDLNSLEKEKSVALANRLNRVNVHASIFGLEQHFPSPDPNHMKLAMPCEVIIDCTGTDSTLVQLTKPIWDSDRLFISLSLSFGARRLYCFSSPGRAFPLKAFNAAIEPWLQKDAADHLDEELPPEGIGCWHPAFPARIDQVWTLGGIAASYVERIVQNTPQEPTLVVYERGSGDDAGTVRRVTL